MAISNVGICNLALQKIGASRIASLSDNEPNAQAVNACFETMRDRELRANRWKFAIKRVVLAPHATAPAFLYQYAYVLPADHLRVIFPVRTALDWKIENHEGELAILTNDGNSIEVRYVARITDATRFDMLFVEALACKIGWHLCEQITQSNTKKDALFNEYRMIVSEARKMNALEIGAQKQPVDEWLVARWNGQLMNSEWGEE